MSNGFNKVIAMGMLGADADVRHTQGGQAVMNFRLAATETYYDKDKQKQQRTEWISCVLWGSRAESLAQYLVKGTQVLIEGKLQTQSYDKDGEKRYRTQVVVNDLCFAGGKRSGDGGDSGDNYEGGDGGGHEQPQQGGSQRAQGKPSGGGYGRQGNGGGGSQGGGRSQGAPQQQQQRQQTQRAAAPQPPPEDPYDQFDNGDGNGDNIPF